MGSPRVLVVEDERVINEAVADRLRAEGFGVEQAYDGPGAVERYAATRPDLVVLDVMLPGFDGLEVCRRIQAARRPVPVLMLTARDDEADVLVGLAVGADDYLTKPFRMRELVARVAPCCAASTGPPSSPPARRPVSSSATWSSTRGRDGSSPRGRRCTSRRPSSTCWPGWRPRRARSSPASACSPTSGTGRTPPAPAPSTAT